MPSNPEFERDCPQSLTAGLQHIEHSLQLDLSDNARQQLSAFLHLLAKWNRTFNLTAIREPILMLYRHIADSLAVLPYCLPSRVLDIGSGAGLPGLPLAIARPQWQFVLLDSNGKKTRFLRQAVMELKLANVEVVNSRIEQYPGKEIFATVIARAFAPLPKMLPVSLPFAAPAGRVVAMLGAPQELPVELQSLLQAQMAKYAMVCVNVPGLQAQRHVLLVDRNGRQRQ